MNQCAAIYRPFLSLGPDTGDIRSWKQKKGATRATTPPTTATAPITATALVKTKVLAFEELSWYLLKFRKISYVDVTSSQCSKILLQYFTATEAIPG